MDDLQSPPEPIPEPKKLTGSQMADAIKDSLSVLFQQTGKNMQEAGADIDAYINRIRPQLDEAAVRATVDPEVAYTNVKYMWANVWAETGRVSLGAIYRERVAVTATVIAVVHALLAVAVA